MSPRTDPAEADNQKTGVSTASADEKVARAIDWDKIAKERGLSPVELEAAKKVFAERADVLRRLS